MLTRRTHCVPFSLALLLLACGDSNTPGATEPRSDDGVRDRPAPVPSDPLGNRDAGVSSPDGSAGDAAAVLDPCTQPADFSGPIEIKVGGVYSGNWESNDPDIAAVTISTSEPVVIERSHIRSRGNLISAAFSRAHLTVRDVCAAGLNPGVAGKTPGRFVVAEEFGSLLIERNDLRQTGGIYARKFVGDVGAGDTIVVRSNRARNIDGRQSTGPDGFSTTAKEARQFFQVNDVTQLPGIDVAYNEVVNEPYVSAVEDNINIYLSSGTASSPLRIHDNFIQGGYPLEPKTEGYSGGGILLSDGSTGDLARATAFVEAFRNTVLDTTNYGVSIAAGHDNKSYENRIFAWGRLPDGSWIKAQNVGSYVWDIYADTAKGTFFNNVSRDNTIGWAKEARADGSITFNDTWFPECARNPESLCTGNVAAHDGVVDGFQATEHARWTAARIEAGVALGPQPLP